MVIKTVEEYIVLLHSVPHCFQIAKVDIKFVSLLCSLYAGLQINDTFLKGM